MSKIKHPTLMYWQLFGTGSGRFSLLRLLDGYEELDHISSIMMHADYDSFAYYHLSMSERTINAEFRRLNSAYELRGEDSIAQLPPEFRLVATRLVQLDKLGYLGRVSFEHTRPLSQMRDIAQESAALALYDFLNTSEIMFDVATLLREGTRLRFSSRRLNDIGYVVRKIERYRKSLEHRWNAVSEYYRPTLQGHVVERA